MNTAYTNTPSNDQDIYRIIRTGNLQQFIVWCENDSDILEEDHYFRYAAQHGQIEIFSYFLEKGYDINFLERLAVREAISHNQINFVQFLYSHPDFRPSLSSDLGHSIQNNVYQLIDYFLEKNAIVLESTIEIVIKKVNLDMLVKIFEYEKSCSLKNKTPSILPFIDYHFLLPRLTLKDSPIINYLIEENLVKLSSLSLCDFKDEALGEWVRSYYHKDALKKQLEQDLSQRVLSSQAKI